MKLKHTKGPWKYTVSKIHGRHQISELKNGSQICAIWSRGKETTEANARLISCAPEMLEELINLYDTIFNTQPECYWSSMKELIEKATGLKIEEVINVR